MKRLTLPFSVLKSRAKAVQENNKESCNIDNTHTDKTFQALTQHDFEIFAYIRV